MEQNVLLPRAEGDISHTARATVFPDGRVRLVIADRPIFLEPGWEARERRAPRQRGAEPTAESMARAARRARRRLYDLCWANPQLEYFITLTLDAARVGDRYDLAAQGKRLTRWLDNAVRRKQLAYVIVPELHADGAIHWHGLISAGGLHFRDSGTLIRPEGGAPMMPRSAAEYADLIEAGAHRVYNLTDWRFGFSTAVRLYGHREAALAYVSKYITKAQASGLGHIGGRWYLHGGQLAEPEVYTYDMAYDEAPDGSYEHIIPQIGARCKICDYYPDRESGEILEG